MLCFYDIHTDQRPLLKLDLQEMPISDMGTLDTVFSNGNLGQQAGCYENGNVYAYVVA